MQKSDADLSNILRLLDETKNSTFKTILFMANANQIAHEINFKFTTSEVEKKLYF